MKKTAIKKLAIVIPLVLVAMFVLSACDTPIPRIPETFVYTTPQFSTNFNYEDPRRQVRCVVVFEVIDEAAIDELDAHSYVIRNSVLTVLGELTMPEITTERNLEEISQRIVDRVNEDLHSHIDLVVGAYFTEFAIA